MDWETYLHYLEPFQREIKEGAPFVLEVVNQSIYEKKRVKAIVCKDFDSLSGADRLWIRNKKEELDPKFWGIEILEEMSGLMLQTDFQGTDGSPRNL